MFDATHTHTRTIYFRLATYVPSAPPTSCEGMDFRHALSCAHAPAKDGG